MLTTQVLLSRPAVGGETTIGIGSGCKGTNKLSGRRIERDNCVESFVDPAPNNGADDGDGNDGSDNADVDAKIGTDTEVGTNNEEDTSCRGSCLQSRSVFVVVCKEARVAIHVESCNFVWETISSLHKLPEEVVNDGKEDEMREVDMDKSLFPP